MSFTTKLVATSAAVLLSLGGCGSGSDPPPPPPDNPESRTLAIEPKLQQTVVWCWAASAEMVLAYYGLPNVNGAGNYQCGLVASWFYGSACTIDCSLCVSTIGPMSNMQTLIDGYGLFVQSVLGIPSRDVSSLLVFRPLSAAEVATEISAGRPIVVGIAPGGGFALPNASQHVAVVVGYDYADGRQLVIVNDPFPFQYPPYNQRLNPYVGAGGVELSIGRYAVPYDSLVGQLGWANSIYQIR